MALTSKGTAKKYKCNVIRDSGFDGSHLFWTAIPINDEDNEDDDWEADWDYADGWTLAELVENIERQLSK